MNEQVKQKWLSALRSGDYQQTQNRLRKEDGFCCLGVLCDIYGKEHNVEWELVDAGVYMFQYGDQYLPSPVMEWAGIETDSPSICGGYLYLSAFNDSGYTFNEISDLIEEHL